LNDFINIIERKGYEWEILEEQKKDKANKYDYITREEGITNAEILEDDKDYNILINKQKEENLSEEETYILDKYFLSKKF
jgi:ribosomal 30S subunit maturation factor RimM